MSEFAKDAFGFLVGCVAVAIVVFAFWGGFALVMAHGQSQTCSRSGGHWIAEDRPVGVIGDSGSVDRTRECRR